MKVNGMLHSRLVPVKYYSPFEYKITQWLFASCASPGRFASYF